MRPTAGLPSLSRRSRTLLIAALVLAALLLIGPRLIGAYTNWLWFGELGFRGVYVKVLVTRLVLFVLVALAVGLVLWTALWLAYRSRPVFVPGGGPNDPIARYRTTVMSRLRLFGIGIPLAFGLLCGLIAQSSWSTVQLFLNGQRFGIKDPQFGLDVGFYAFDLPFYRLIINWLFVAVVVAFFANLVTHYIFGGLRLTGREGTLSRAGRIQLATLAGLFVVLKAIAYWLDRYSLLSSSRKEPTFTGGSYTDINAVLPAKMILLSIAIVCALAFFAGVVLRDLRVPALAGALLILSSILVGAVWPLVVEQFSVRPNAADKERVYIQRNIDATRNAYGITPDKVSYQEYKGTAKQPDATKQQADSTTIQNIRLLDPTILSPTFTQQQQNRNWYGFPSPLDIDRYTLDGKLQDVVVAARELSPKSLSGNQTDWINRHTVYTHGNGFVAAPANEVSAGAPVEAGQAPSDNLGLPVYTDKIKVDQPRIYYGEVIAQADPDYAIVGSNGQPAREYESDNEQFTYDGKGGVPIGNWFTRFAFAAKYTERNILFSGAIGSNSKIIFHRDPRDRVQRVAPWLTTDTDAYPAVVDGKIVWIVDAYTTLDNFPYAQRSSLQGLATDSVDQTTGQTVPRKSVSYIRNSVKATVDAYDGTVKLYQVDDNDPVLKAWMGVFPGTVHPQSEVSADLRAHFRYPEDLFKVQREMLAKYHVSDPREFFTNNAFWSVPEDPTSEGAASYKQPPYYVVTGDPKTGKPVFNLTSAMVVYGRQFLSAYISVRSDPDGYGKFSVLTLPPDTNMPGPQLTQSAMQGDTRVSTQKTQISGSNKIQYGNLLTLPIGDGGILNVEPMYTERLNTQSPIPQLAKVLVRYNRPGEASPKIGYADTLSEALAQVFSGTPSVATPPGVEPPQVVVPPPSTTPPGTQSPSTPAPDRSAAIADLKAAIDAVQNAKQNLASGNGNLADLGAAEQRLLDAANAAVK